MNSSCRARPRRASRGERGSFSIEPSRSTRVITRIKFTSRDSSSPRRGERSECGIGEEEGQKRKPRVSRRGNENETNLQFSFMKIIGVRRATCFGLGSNAHSADRRHYLRDNFHSSFARSRFLSLFRSFLRFSFLLLLVSLLLASRAFNSVSRQRSSVARPGTHRVCRVAIDFYFF